MIEESHATGTHHRVFVTGVGVVAPNAIGIDALWRQCLEGISCARQIPDTWPAREELNSPYWAPLALPDFESFGLGRVERMQNDPVALNAAVALGQAIEQAGLGLTEHNRRHNTFRVESVSSDRLGIYSGTGISGVSSFLSAHRHHLLAGLRSKPELADYLGPLFDSVPDRFNPFTVSMSMPNATTSFLAIKYGVQGANDTVCAACASGTAAIGHGMRAIRSGALDIAFAGGTEYLDDPHGSVFRSFDVARTLVDGSWDAERAARPFDEQRSGFLFSAGGSAYFVLESESSVVARGVRPIGEILAYGESFDAYSIMAMEPEGHNIEAMLERLLLDAVVEHDAVGYINAHGTGTRINDEVEAGVIERVFGQRSVLPVVNSTKALIGHALGASGALEAAVTLRSLAAGIAHPMPNLETPIAGLNFAREPTPITAPFGISQSFAFGGHNAALALRACD